MSETISYYDQNAQHFFDDTANVDMGELYSEFLHHIPKGGRILDAGCGSGRDTRHFLQQGYDVTAFDASAAMCRLASEFTGICVVQRTFEQVDWRCTFDGIWACASLLHVARDQIEIVLQKLCRALKPEGVMFMSFKFRDGQWEQGGRFFNGYNETTLRAMLADQPAEVLKVWTTFDQRPERRGEQWLNALIVPTSNR